MIINTRTTASSLFSGIAEALHITIIVVRPNESYVFWYLQTSLIHIEGFFVGHEYLWHFLCLLSREELEEFALVGNHVGKHCHAFLWGGLSAHSLVVYASHCHGVDILEFVCFSHAIGKLAEDGATVGAVVPFAIAMGVPFREGCIVEKHGLAVTGGDDDPHLVCHDLAFGMRIERTSATVHGRSHHVATET